MAKRRKFNPDADELSESVGCSPEEVVKVMAQLGSPEESVQQVFRKAIELCKGDPHLLAVVSFQLGIHTYIDSQKRDSPRKAMVIKAPSVPPPLPN